MNQLKIKTSWLKRMETLSDAECGRLFRGMLLYASCGETPSLSGSERIVWAVAMEEIDDQLSISDKRAEAGRAGGSKTKQTEANGSKPKQNEANESKTKKEKALPSHSPVIEKQKKGVSKDTPKEKNELTDALTAFKEMRNRMHKPMTQLAVDLLVQKLHKLSGGDVQKQIAILYQSIENGWTGVYELKQEQRTRQRNTLKNYAEEGKNHPELGEIELNLNEL